MALCPGGVKIVFVLLTKRVAFHMQIAIVQVGVPCLQGPVRGLFSGICWRGRWSRSGSGIPAVFQIRLHILPKQVLGERRGKSSCGKSSCGKSNCGRSRCSGARCSGDRCSGGGVWSGRAKVCLGGREATRLGGSSVATRGGSPGNTQSEGSSHRGSAAEGIHLLG